MTVSSVDTICTIIEILETLINLNKTLDLFEKFANIEKKIVLRIEFIPYLAYVPWNQIQYPTSTHRLSFRLVWRHLKSDFLSISKLNNKLLLLAEIADINNTVAL